MIIALLVLIIGFWIVRLLLRLLGKSKLMKKDPTVTKFLSGTIKISLNTLVIVTVIGILGVPMSSVIAVIASAGVAIGLALQGALSNFAGGIMILIFRPFRIGDFVDAGGYSGTVKEIGIFYTVMTTPDNREVTIPNGTITGSSVVNYSVNDTRRVDLTVSVAYGSDINRVQHVLLEEAAKQTLALTDPAPSSVSPSRTTVRWTSPFGSGRKKRITGRFTLTSWKQSRTVWKPRRSKFPSRNWMFTSKTIPMQSSRRLPIR